MRTRIIRNNEKGRETRGGNNYKYTRKGNTPNKLVKNNKIDGGDKAIKTKDSCHQQGNKQGGRHQNQGN